MPRPACAVRRRCNFPSSRAGGVGFGRRPICLPRWWTARVFFIGSIGGISLRDGNSTQPGGLLLSPLDTTAYVCAETIIFARLFSGSGRAQRTQPNRLFIFVSINSLIKIDF